MAIDYVKLGLRISDSRKSHKLTQEQLAETITATRQYIAMVELGKKYVSLDMLIDIANTLEVSADDLLVDSLKRSSSTANTELHQLLLDCTEAEEQILIELVKFMKTVLYRQGI